MMMHASQRPEAGDAAGSPLPGELARYAGWLGDRPHGWTFREGTSAEPDWVPLRQEHAHRGGRMQSPVLPLDKPADEAAYYSLAFKARTAGHAYWWVDLFDAGGQWLPDINSAVYPGDAIADYRQMIYVERLAQRIQLAFDSRAGVQAGDLVLQRVQPDAAATWCDRVYEALPPLDFAPPSDAFDRLPRTAAALRDGRPWRVVMLGDSLMNDSFNSVFQALVKRDFPRSNLDFTISVRGSTGCWFYGQPEPFNQYVARHQPDLLMIGGISNLNEDRDDFAAGMRKVAAVIRQAQALGSEVILLSPPFSTDWRPVDDRDPSANLPVAAWTETMRSEKNNPFHAWTPYAETARACGAAFWNLTVPTVDYVARSRTPHGFFNRDAVHNNDRGKQIIGRTLQRYFQTAGQ